MKKCEKVAGKAWGDIPLDWLRARIAGIRQNNKTSSENDATPTRTPGGVETARVVKSAPAPASFGDEPGVDTEDGEASVGADGPMAQSGHTATIRRLGNDPDDYTAYLKIFDSPDVKDELVEWARGQGVGILGRYRVLRERRRLLGGRRPAGEVREGFGGPAG